MLKPVLIFSAAALLCLARVGNPTPRAQDPPPAAPVPIAADTKNPLKDVAGGKAKAKKMFGYDCEMCHNGNGDGKTDLAKGMGLEMTDLSDPKTLAGKSDGDIYNIIHVGKGKMPAEDPSRAKPDDVWNLVLYVRAMAKN